jgi:TM2 domain-containing membrane protein YozV
MNRSVNAALISGLVFPGAGHLYLRRPLRGCVFLLPALFAAFVYAGDIISRVSEMLDQVLAGRVAPDPVAIAARLEAQGGGSAFVTACGIVFLVCWIGSIIDSFVVERSAAPRAQQN